MISANEYLKKYYYNNITKDIQVFFLEEHEYNKKYKELTKKINNKSDKDYVDTAGYYLFDSKENKHYVLLKNYNIDCNNFYILNLYHELSHIETLPYKVGLQLDKTKKKKQYVYDGYLFWREYIAQYEAFNKYLMQIDDILFLKDDNSFQNQINRLCNNFEDNLYEIILCCEIKNDYIKKIENESKELILLLKSIKEKLFAKQDIKNISIDDLNKIGLYVNKILDKYYSHNKEV